MRKPKHTFSKSMLLCFSVVASGHALAYPLDLGLAGEFNVFVLGDMAAADSDIEGRLAVGGNLTLNNYSVGSKLSNSLGARDDLIVGGDITLTNTRIYNGNARSGGVASIAQTVGFYSDDDPNRLNGSYIPGNPLDFNVLSDELIDKSASWGALSSAGSQMSMDAWGNVKLTGSDAAFNIFSVSASDLSKATSFWIDVPLGAQTLVNVSGNDVTMNDFGFFRSDANGEKVQVLDNSGDSLFTQGILFNLFGATSLNLHAISIEGSLLAPLATTRFYDGQINGNMILGAWDLVYGEYAGEAHNVPLLTAVPPLTANVPIPPVGMLFLISLGLLRPRHKLKSN